MRRQRGAHAYLFIGPEGIGKRLFATCLAQCLFCERTSEADLDACGECAACRQIQAGTHADLLTIACPEGKRELPISLMIGERDKRGKTGLCHELAMRPMTASRRIAVIDDAQTMTREAANALLKTLEEPPPGSILFLLTPSADAILPTIRSRCQPVTFAPLGDDDVVNLMLALGWVTDRSLAAETAALAEGSLATAEQLLQPELRRMREIVFGAFDQPSFDPLKTTEDVLAALDELGSDSSTQRRYSGWAVRFCVESLRRQLRVRGEADPGEFDKVSLQIDRCLDAEGHLAQSMPIPLCLESLFDELARIRRGAVPV